MSNDYLRKRRMRHYSERTDSGRRRETRQHKNEGLWDFFVNHGHEVALAKSVLDYVTVSAMDTKRALSRAEESESPEDTQVAQDALSEFVKCMADATSDLEDMELIDLSIYNR